MKNILIDVQMRPESLAILQGIPGVNIQLVEPAEDARPLPTKTIRDIHAIFCSYLPTNHAEMQALEFVQICSSGYTQLLDLNLSERGIRAANVTGVFDVAIAE